MIETWVYPFRFEARSILRLRELQENEQHSRSEKSLSPSLSGINQKIAEFLQHQSSEMVLFRSVVMTHPDSELPLSIAMSLVFEGWDKNTRKTKVETILSGVTDILVACRAKEMVKITPERPTRTDLDSPYKGFYLQDLREDLYNMGPHPTPTPSVYKKLLVVFRESGVIGDSGYISEHLIRQLVMADNENDIPSRDSFIGLTHDELKLFWRVVRKHFIQQKR